VAPSTTQHEQSPAGGGHVSGAGTEGDDPCAAEGQSPPDRPLDANHIRGMLAYGFLGNTKLGEFYFLGVYEPAIPVTYVVQCQLFVQEGLNLQPNTI
jgi:hypothetical protein